MYTDTGDGILGTNVYAYCQNDPVNKWDPSGYAPTNIFFVYDKPGKDLIMQAEWMARYAYKNKNVEFIYIRTADDFIREWNELASREIEINDIHLFFHGGPGVLYFKGSELFASEMYKELERISISGRGYLYACNGGTIPVDKTSISSTVAIAFSSRIYGKRVRALVDGYVDYRDWYQLSWPEGGFNLNLRPLTKTLGAYWADFALRRGRSPIMIDIGGGKRWSLG